MLNIILTYIIWRANNRMSLSSVLFTEFPPDNKLLVDNYLKSLKLFLPF